MLVNFDISQILSMPAGSQINSLVAENIFGLKLEKNYGLAGGYYWTGKGMSFGDMPERSLPDYSGDNGLSLEVAEKMSDKWNFAIVNNQHFREHPNDRYGFRLQAKDVKSRIKTIFAVADTISLAICRSSLVAVMNGSFLIYTVPEREG